jgi:hypothetical protein
MASQDVLGFDQLLAQRGVGMPTQPQNRPRASNYGSKGTYARAVSLLVNWMQAWGGRKSSGAWGPFFEAFIIFNRERGN